MTGPRHPLFLATLTTSAFTFTTVGVSRAHARNLMRAAWERHAAQTGATLTYAEVSDSVRVVGIRTGTVLRDHEPFPA